MCSATTALCCRQRWRALAQAGAWLGGDGGQRKTRLRRLRRRLGGGGFEGVQRHPGASAAGPGARAQIGCRDRRRSWRHRTLAPPLSWFQRARREFQALMGMLAGGSRRRGRGTLWRMRKRKPPPASRSLRRPTFRRPSRQPRPLRHRRRMPRKLAEERRLAETRRARGAETRAKIRSKDRSGQTGSRRQGRRGSQEGGRRESC